MRISAWSCLTAPAEFTEFVRLIAMACEVAVAGFAEEFRATRPLLIRCKTQHATFEESGRVSPHPSKKLNPEGAMPNSQMSTARSYINLPGHEAVLPFSDAVLVGNALYLSGRIGIDPLTGRVPADVATEIKLLLDGVEAVLAQVDMTMDDLVSVQVFSPDLSLWGPFNAAYVKRFSRELPARAFIGSGPLLMGGRFEMMGDRAEALASHQLRAKARADERLLQGFRTLLVCRPFGSYPTICLPTK